MRLRIERGGAYVDVMTFEHDGKTVVFEMRDRDGWGELYGRFGESMRVMGGYLPVVEPVKKKKGK